MARPPKVTNEELIEVLQDGLNWPAVAALSTAEVADTLDGSTTTQTVRNRLKAAHEDADVPIAGLHPSEQSGWVWWLTNESLYR